MEKINNNLENILDLRPKPEIKTAVESIKKNEQPESAKTEMRTNVENLSLAEAAMSASIVERAEKDESIKNRYRESF